MSKDFLTGLNLLGSLALASELVLTNTGTLDDFAPTGLDNAYRVSWQGTTSSIITGLGTGTPGRLVVLSNDSTTSVLALAVNSTRSIAANRFNFANMGRSAHVLLFPGDVVVLRYTSGGWLEERISPHRSQSLLTNPRVLRMVPSTGTGMASLGIAPTSMGGTLSHPAMSNSFRGQLHRTQGTTTTTAGTSTGVRGTNNLCLRGAAANVGGFHFKTQFFYSNIVATRSWFCGLFPTAAIGNVEADTITNAVGFYARTSDTEINVGANDASGTATLSSLGTNFPVNTTALYECHLFALPNAGSIQYALVKLDDLTILPAVGSLTTKLPTTGTLLTPVIWGNNRTTAAAFDIAWTDFELRLP